MRNVEFILCRIGVCHVWFFNLYMVRALKKVEMKLGMVGVKFLEGLGI